jgi:predicted regulator of Ras-like GTPase activity (Roadblock/LC7/MglB family)
VASADGALLAVETRVADAGLVANMSAVAADTAARIAEEAGVGRYTSCLVEGSSGHMTVHPLEANMVSIDDLPRIDLSMVDKGHTKPATPEGG